MASTGRRQDLQDDALLGADAGAGEQIGVGPAEIAFAPGQVAAPLCVGRAGAGFGFGFGEIADVDQLVFRAGRRRARCRRSRVAGRICPGRCPWRSGVPSCAGGWPRRRRLRVDRPRSRGLGGRPATPDRPTGRPWRRRRRPPRPATRCNAGFGRLGGRAERRLQVGLQLGRRRRRGGLRRGRCRPAFAEKQPPSKVRQQQQGEEARCSLDCGRRGRGQRRGIAAVGRGSAVRSPCPLGCESGCVQLSNSASGRIARYHCFQC